MRQTAFGPLSVLAAAAFAWVGGAEAADLAPKAPGVAYTFGAVDRGNVTVLSGATFEIRSDGCWTNRFSAENRAGKPISLTIYITWRPVSGVGATTIEAFDDRAVAPGRSGPNRTRGCSPRLAEHYAALTVAGVSRTIEVDD
ncbi:MAG: hypothetical protein ROR55_23745 [Devosia sp.]